MRDLTSMPVILIDKSAETILNSSRKERKRFPVHKIQIH